MREIKFRGLNVNGEWIYGYPTIFEGENKQIISNMVGQSFIQGFNRETLGQYTGLKDKNGKEIYEGDIVKAIDCYCEWGQPEEILFESGCFGFFRHSDSKRDTGIWENIGDDYDTENCIEVIGNKFENPELLDGNL